MELKLIRHKPEELFTRVQSTRFWVRVVQCPLCRLAIAVVFMVPAAVVHTLLRTQVVQRLDSPFDHVARALQIALAITVFIVAYRLAGCAVRQTSRQGHAGTPATEMTGGATRASSRPRPSPSNKGEADQAWSTSQLISTVRQQLNPKGAT